MSSKLTKKLLQQMAEERSSSDDGEYAPNSNIKPEASSSEKISKEELVQEHIQSMIRMDGLVQRYSSSTAQKSFDRHSSSMKRKQKESQSLKRNKLVVGNSRSSSSAFEQRPHQRTYDKERAKRKKEKDYFADLAKALKKTKGGSKKRRTGER